jgi:hypothetical protein
MSDGWSKRTAEERRMFTENSFRVLLLCFSDPTTRRASNRRVLTKRQREDGTVEITHSTIYTRKDQIYILFFCFI